MSKQDKHSRDGRLSDAMASADYADLREPQILQDAQADEGTAERSRLFNAWLDRALPVLQQYLSDSSTTGAVTSAGSKPKH
jgi:hypothetical protein